MELGRITKDEARVNQVYLIQVVRSKHPQEYEILSMTTEYVNDLVSSDLAAFLVIFHTQKKFFSM